MESLLMVNEQALDDIYKRINSTKKVNILLLIALVLCALAAMYFYSQQLALSQLLEEKNKHIIELTQNQLEKSTNEEDVNSLTNQKSEFVRQTTNARYAVGVYAYNITKEQFATVRNFISNEGYYMTADSLLQEKPSWLAGKSTVHYYDRESKEKAQQLADALTKLTGIQFVTNHGAGYGVIKGQEKWTFFIHVIGT